MFAANADWFAPGDAQGIPTTTDVQHVIRRRYQLDPPSLLVGVAGLLALLFFSHHLTRGRGR